MALTVEDGTNVSSADSYDTLANIDAYHTAKGNATWTGDDTTVKEPAIRRATAALDAYDWMGLRTNGRDQPLAWPRSGVYDDEGYSIATTEIPQEVKNALAELALRELVTPGSLAPDVTPGSAVKSERIGDIAVEYANPSVTTGQARTLVSVVGPLIGQFLKNGGGNPLAGSSYRL